VVKNIVSPIVTPSYAVVRVAAFRPETSCTEVYPCIQQRGNIFNIYGFNAVQRLEKNLVEPGGVEPPS